jgi:hypothetical protein
LAGAILVVITEPRFGGACFLRRPHGRQRWLVYVRIYKIWPRHRDQAQKSPPSIIADHHLNDL